MNQEVVF